MGMPRLVSFAAVGAIRVPCVSKEPGKAKMGRTLGLTPV